MSVWHDTPLNPSAQTHVKPFTASTHVPLFWHGLDVHSILRRQTHHNQTQASPQRQDKGNSLIHIILSRVSCLCMSPASLPSTSHTTNQLFTLSNQHHQPTTNHVFKRTVDISLADETRITRSARAVEAVHSVHASTTIHTRHRSTFVDVSGAVHTGIPTVART